MELLRLHTTGPIARILIDNPQRRNALSRAMWRAIPEVVQQALATPGIRVLVLQGATPGTFAAGADISEFEQTYASQEEALRANAEIQAAVDALEQCPLPTVALIDGACVGGGISLATACDVRWASARARFAVTPSKLGLSYHPEDLRRLVQACGLAAASELLYSGQIWDAPRALQTGLISLLLPVEEFEAAGEALVQAMAANSLTANQAIKQGLRAVLQRDAAAYAQAAQTFEDLFAAPDFLEGRNAFLEKRPARFPSHGSRE